MGTRLGGLMPEGGGGGGGGGVFAGHYGICNTEAKAV